MDRYMSAPLSVKVSVSSVLHNLLTCAVDARRSDSGVIDGGAHHAVQDPLLLGSEMWELTKCGHFHLFVTVIKPTHALFTKYNRAFLTRVAVNNTTTWLTTLALCLSESQTFWKFLSWLRGHSILGRNSLPIDLTWQHKSGKPRCLCKNAIFPLKQVSN